MNIIYKYSLLVAFCISSNLYSQLNITYKSKLPFPGKQLSNLWGYTDSLGREFALVGHSTGMTIVDVTDPTTPASLFTVPGPNSTWREVRTKDKYAFVTTEGGQGLKIVNLSYLPDSIQTKNYTGDGTIAGMIDNIHALHVDGNYLYLYGASDIGEGGALMLDVTNPWNPVFKGDFQDWYVHDGIVRNDTAYFAHISDGFFTVVNTANKANPVLMASQNTPGNFSHNTWLSDDSKTLFTTDEKDNAYVAAYDVTDLGNIKELDRIQHNPGTNSVPHNTYILNDYAVT
jgi:choice-of-anchor B domain-containing protein